MSTAHLLRALELQFKFAMLVSDLSTSTAADANTSINSDGSSASTGDVPTAVEELCLERMGWAQAVLLAHVSNARPAEPEAKKTSGRRKRKTADNDKPGKPNSPLVHHRHASALALQARG